MTSEWRRHLVNYRQEPEERRAKYLLCRSLGSNAAWAQRMRDWRWDKISRKHGYRDFNHLNELLSGEALILTH